MAPMSITDMRGQMFANALVAFPHIVHQHYTKIPFPVPRAQDIFEISISMQSVQHGVQSAQHSLRYIARLTHRHMITSPLYVLLMCGGLEISVPHALSSLLAASCDMLGKIQANIIERPPGNRNVLDTFSGAYEGNTELQMKNAKARVQDLREAVKLAARSKAESDAAAMRELIRLNAEADAAEQRQVARLKEETEAAALRNQAPKQELNKEGSQP
jgi:hypothetical protein